MTLTAPSHYAHSAEATISHCSICTKSVFQSQAVRVAPCGHEWHFEYVQYSLPPTRASRFLCPICLEHRLTIIAGGLDGGARRCAGSNSFLRRARGSLELNDAREDSVDFSRLMSRCFSRHCRWRARIIRLETHCVRSGVRSSPTSENAWYRTGNETGFCHL